MKRIMLILLFYIKLLSFSNENILIVEIINLGNKLYSRNPKIESSVYKLPFSKIIYNLNGEIEEISYKKQENGSFKKVSSYKKYDCNKLKKLLEDIYNDNFGNEDTSVSCRNCSILELDITILTEAPVQSKENIVKIYEEVLSQDEKGGLFINGNQIESMGLLYKIEYKDTVIMLYEDRSFYKNENTKKFIDFINLSVNNIPQREYMRNYIKEVKQIEK